MFASRLRLAQGVVLLGLCAVTGCQSATAPGGLLARVNRPKSDKALASAKPGRAPARMPGQLPGQGPGEAPAQANVMLAPGTEIQWEAKPAQDQPGQVTSGKAAIGPDGTIVVGPYGACRLGGLNMNQATVALEKHLAPYMKSPIIQLSAVMPAPMGSGTLTPGTVMPATMPQGAVAPLPVAPTPVVPSPAAPSAVVPNPIPPSVDTIMPVQAVETIVPAPTANADVQTVTFRAARGS